MLAQYLVHLGVADTHSFCQLACGPVSGGFRFFLFHDATEFRLNFVAHRGDARLLRRLLQQALDAALIESSDDLTDGTRTNPQR